MYGTGIKKKHENRLQDGVLVHNFGNFKYTVLYIIHKFKKILVEVFGPQFDIKRIALF